MFTNITDKEKTRVEIDLTALVHNYEYTKKLVGDKKIICVVKADAYGHGAVRVAHALTKCGADFFAVANIDEALELREAGIKSNILILGYVFPMHIKEAVNNGISLSAASLDALKSIVLQADGAKTSIHIKINTGMNRTGFNVCRGDIPNDLKTACEIIKRTPNIEVEGLFSHFAAAEDNSGFTKIQFERYKQAESYITSQGITPKLRHICNSAGALNFPEMHLDAVREGITLYGCEDTQNNYLPVMQFKTKIVDIHELCEGDFVSYGLTYKADKPTRMAVIAAGYADGLRRSLSCGKGYVLCHGRKVPIIGRVCMDMTMIDVTDISDVKIGDDAIIWGADSGEAIICGEVARLADTISYELLCGVNKRVPRIYTE